MLTKIGFSLQSQYNRPMTQIISLLNKAGFSAVSPLWSPELDMSVLVECVRDYGMTIQSLHAPHKDIDLLWTPDSVRSIQAQENIIRSIDVCAQFQIPILVLHGWQGFIYTFQYESLDFRFFDHLVAYAKKLGVSIAFENLEGEEFLDALMTRYAGESNVGFCWDSGHAHCYPHKLDFLKEYGDRLIMTHLNDNWGLRDPNGNPSGYDDLHFLPFDGNIDWDNAISQLKEKPRQNILNFELKTLSHSKAHSDLLYANIPLEQFLAEAGIRAKKIAQMYDDIMCLDLDD